MSPHFLWTAVIGVPDPRLTDWLDESGLSSTRFADPHDAMIAKNSAIRAFLASGQPQLLMIDGDQIPNRDTRILGEPDCSLAYCGYASRTVPRKGHFGEGDFGAGCCRVAREVLVAMATKLDALNLALSRVCLPIEGSVAIGWFHRPVRDYGSEEFRCPCEWFHALAQSVGFRACMLGTIGHAVSESEVLLLEDGYVPFANRDEGEK